jgi:hypothetical protein
MAISMLEARLPGDLVEGIARSMHRMALEDCHAQLINQWRDINTLLQNADCKGPMYGLNLLKERYPDMRVYIDSWGTWHNVLVELVPEERYVAFTYYNDFGEAEATYMCEFTVRSDSGVVLREWFSGRDNDDLLDEVKLPPLNQAVRLVRNDKTCSFKDPLSVRTWFMSLMSLQYDVQNMPQYVYLVV